MKVRRFVEAFKSPYDPKPLEEWLKNQPIKTIPALFRKTLSEHGTRPFLGHKEDGTYVYRSYNEVNDLVLSFSSALIEVGVEAHDRVAQISANRPEWAITDLGTMFIGACHAPLYATVSKGAFTYILNDSAAKILVAENPGHLAMLKECQDDLKHLDGVVALVPFDPKDFKKKIWSWDDFLKLGKDSLEKNKDIIEKRIEGLSGTDVCSLVYTSGTTGEPKGAMLMHGNFVSNAVSVRPNIDLEPGDIELSFLPLSHVFERTLFYLVITIGGTIAYAESMETVRDNILEVRPHLVASVPRLYEKIQAAIIAKVQNPDQALFRTKKRLFAWAFDVGKQRAEASWNGAVPGALELQFRLAKKLVLGKIHDATGGRIKVFASGGAPLRADVCEFFLSAGFTLIEGYGLTETSPVITMNPPKKPKIGTVGVTIKDVELRIGDNGEIQSRGPHIMRGYFNKYEATAEVIDKDGWFHTGDVGVIDKEGYLAITDRIKELIVLSNGKNVAPSPIEQAIKESRYVEQVVVLGDKRNFISALVVPAFEAMKSWCAENGVSSEPEEMAKDPKVVEMLTKVAVDACQSFSPYEQVKKVAILPRELSQEHGELTPTLKTKRRVVDENFKEVIDAIYAS